MATKKRKIRGSALVIIALSAVLLTAIVLLTSNLAFIGKKSIHSDAKSYRTRHCLVFYPNGDIGLKKARELCKGRKDDRIFDYSLVPYGDYYMVSYGEDLKYFVDQEYNSLQISGIREDSREIVLDYLRYTLKKEDPDKYYNAEYLKSVDLDSIDFSSITYSIEGEDLRCELADYEKTLYIPLRYAQKAIGMDFGFPNETYRRPVYIDPERPVICLTFDDGPQLWYEKGITSTEAILDVLYEYDANGTFYVVGTNLEDRDYWADYQVYNLLKSSIAHGNEYGSHTQTHLYSLTDLKTAEEISREISGPIDFMKEFMDYEMKTYRPVEGAFDDNVLNAQPVGAVLWDIDSEDWLSMDPSTIIDRVLNEDIDSGDIIIFHDIYDETGEALKTIIPELLNRGYQMVTVSDMMNYFKVDIDQFKVIFSATDYR